MEVCLQRDDICVFSDNVREGAVDVALAKPLFVLYLMMCSFLAISHPLVEVGRLLVEGELRPPWRPRDARRGAV